MWHAFRLHCQRESEVVENGGDEWGKSGEMGKGREKKRNKQVGKRNEARTKPNKFDLIALLERQKGGKAGKARGKSGVHCTWGYMGDHSVITPACGVLWRLLFNGLMLPPNKYKTIRMRRCHLALAANFSLCVSYFFLHSHTHTHTSALKAKPAWPPLEDSTCSFIFRLTSTSVAASSTSPPTWPPRPPAPLTHTLWHALGCH